MENNIYKSHVGQDKWVLDFFKNKKGFFIEAGAYDGVILSNTYALEQLGWNGICIEANPTHFNELIKNRKSLCFNYAVSNKTETCKFFPNGLCGHLSEDKGTIEIQKTTFVELIPSTIAEVDYLSLDVEGHEIEALEGYPFHKIPPKLITIEHNSYCGGQVLKNKIYEFLIHKGYFRFKEDILLPKSKWLPNDSPFEDWYIRN